MKVGELKPILEYLDDNVEVAIVFRNENHNIISRNENHDEVFLTLEDDGYDESFWI